MNYTIIIRPLIGAGIGYITNWIAVKMMFRPLKPVKIGNFTLPFTPGVIPRNKARIAKSIGNAISNDLLTEDVIIEKLLSDEIKLKLKEKIESSINLQENNSDTIKEIVSSHIAEENYEKINIRIKEKLTEIIFENIKNADLGNNISKQIENSAKEGISKSILGLFGGGAIISTISNIASQKINQYIDENGKMIISDMVSKEFENYSSKSMSEIIKKLDNSDIDYVSIIIKIYEKFIMQQMPDLIKSLNISKLISDKIEKMDILEVEKLILSITKKELNSLVNLGAIIGFLLGLLNLLF